MTHHRIDAAHSNIVAAWERMRGGADWPDDHQWRVLRKANTLAELSRPVIAPGGAAASLELDFTLPMPGVSCIELTPEARRPGRIRGPARIPRSGPAGEVKDGGHLG